MAVLQHLRVDLAVQKYIDELLDAASIGDLGDAVSRLSEGFDLHDVAIFEAGKAADIYPLDARGTVKRLDDPPSPHMHAVLAFVRAADRPVRFDDIRRGVGSGCKDWLRLAPAWLRHGDGLMLAAPSRSRGAWYLRYAGTPRPLGAAEAVLHVAGELAYRRHEEMALVKVASAPLTARERQVMRLLSAGKTDCEVASELSISARTVRFHVDNAKRKLGVSSRAQAIVHSLRARQLIASPPVEASKRGRQPLRDTLE